MKLFNRNADNEKGEMSFVQHLDELRSHLFRSAVAIALGAAHPSALSAMALYDAGLTAAALANAALIWVMFGSADRVTGRMGPNGRRTVTRLAAFMLLCIGVQILIGGVQDVLHATAEP